MIKRYIFIIILILFCIASKAKTTKSVIILQEKNQQNACFELLYKIVKTSEYNIKFEKKYQSKKEFIIYIDEATKKKIRIQILLKNKVDTNITLGWLELDLAKNQLTDISNDPTHPILLKFDFYLLSKFKKNCLKYCLD